MINNKYLTVKFSVDQYMDIPYFSSRDGSNVSSCSADTIFWAVPDNLYYLEQLKNQKLSRCQWSFGNMPKMVVKSRSL